MIRLSYDCPTTGERLRTGVPFMERGGAQVDSVAMHCPKCGKLHRFRRREALLELGADRGVRGTARA